MNREFVLRDNEVAFNMPDGAVVIMNLNALNALKQQEGEDSDELTAAKARIKMLEDSLKMYRQQTVNDREGAEDAVREALDALATARRQRDEWIMKAGELEKKLEEKEARFKEHCNRHKNEYAALQRNHENAIIRLEDLVAEVEEWKKKHMLMSQDRNRLVEELRNLRDSHYDAIGEANKKIQELQAQLTKVTEEKDRYVTAYEAQKKWHGEECRRIANHREDLVRDMRDEIAKLRAQVEAAKNAAKETQQPKPMYEFSQVSYGQVLPEKFPSLVIVADDSRVFFTQVAVEKFYDLPKGSVSAYYNYRQQKLVCGCSPADPRCALTRLGLVWRETETIFKNYKTKRDKDVNLDGYNKAVIQARKNKTA